MRLDFTINDSVMTLTHNEQITNYSQDVPCAVFSINGSDWDDMTTICAQFTRGANSYDMDITQTKQCKIPSAVLDGVAQNITVTVYGFNSNGARITTNYVNLEISESNYANVIEDDQKTQTYYEALTEKVDEAKSAVDAGLQKAVQDYLSTHPISITGMATQEELNSAVASVVAKFADYYTKPEVNDRTDEISNTDLAALLN